MNKSQISQLVAEGICQEMFKHATMGTFNITLLRQQIAERKLTARRSYYAAMRSVDGVECDTIQFLMDNREWDKDRCRELSAEQLAEPLIFLLCPPGANGEGETHLLVDGIHRLIERRHRGCEDFWLYLIPLYEAPRVAEDLVLSVPWGLKEVIDGKLVDR